MAGFDLRQSVPDNKVMSSLIIKDPRAQALAAELARRTGESLEDAVVNSLEQRLTRVGNRTGVDPDLLKDLHEIARRSAALPVRDTRSDDEILGYNDAGTFD